MSSPSKRRDMDVMKLMMSNYEVMMSESNNPSDFYVKFRGPADSPYDGGVWKIHVILPVNYPYKSPSIGFCNKIFHPNVDEASGSVCLDVINQTWSPMFDLVNIFSVFLPQLLLYPNPSDPLNGQAAQLMFKDPEGYKAKVKEHVKQHASVDFKLNGDKDVAEDADDNATADDDANDSNPISDADDDVQLSEPDEPMSDLDDAPEEDGIEAQA